VFLEFFLFEVFFEVLVEDDPDEFRWGESLFFCCDAESLFCVGGDFCGESVRESDAAGV